MTIDRETRSNIKDSINTLVEQKVKLTRERHDYKLRTCPLLQTGEVTESERARFFGAIDSERSSLKYEIRHLLLLYGYIRGRNYKQLEPKCGKTNKPSPGGVFYCAQKNNIAITDDEVAAWFDGTPSPHKWSRRKDEAEAA